MLRVQGSRRRLDKRLLLLSALIAVGIALVVAGVAGSVTGRAAQGLPDTIESINPVRNAVQVPSQSELFVDLLPGYTGVFVVDGLELVTTNLDSLGQGQAEPGQQIPVPHTTIYEPGNATLTFQPTKGAAIETFTQGSHTVTVLYWKVIEGRSHAISFTWTFNVF